MKKLRRTAALLAALPLMLTSCGEDKTLILSSPSTTEISFSWWGNDSRHDYTISAVNTFEKLHDSIDVTCHYSEWSGYPTRNNVQMLSNTECDVMQINYSWINQYSPSGNGYYDLNELREYIDFSGYTDEELSYGMKNGKLNAVPIALNTMTMYFNKTVYDRYGLDIPETFDDLFRAAEVMNGECYPLALSQKPAWFLLCSYAGQMHNKSVMTENGKITLTKDEIKELIQFYCDMVEKKVIPQVDDFDKRNLASGKYASTLVWLSDAQNYCAAPQENGYEMIVGDYITVNGKLKSWYVKPATLYAIRKNTSAPREAAALLDYLINSEEMAMQQKTEKGIPLSKKARDVLSENDELNGIQADAFDVMSKHQNELEAISPYFETDVLYKSFTSSCTDVLYKKSDIDTEADRLYDIFTTYQTQE